MWYNISNNKKNAMIFLLCPAFPHVSAHLCRCVVTLQHHVMIHSVLRVAVSRISLGCTANVKLGGQGISVEVGSPTSQYYYLIYDIIKKAAAAALLLLSLFRPWLTFSHKYVYWPV